MRGLLFLLLSVFPYAVLSQIYTKEALAADLDFLHAAVQEGHPAGPEASERLLHFNQLVKENAASELTPFIYENTIREALQQVHCIHTSISFSPLTKIFAPVSKPYFPYRLFASGEDLYITAILNDSVPEIQLPARVLSVNGVDAATLIRYMVQYIPADGPQKTFGYKLLEKSAPVLVRRYFYEASQFKLVYETQNLDTASLTAFPVASLKKEIQILPVYILKNASAGLYKLDSVANTYVLEITTFGGRKHQSFYKKVLAYINEQQAAQVVIDLRGNGGGSRYAVADFLTCFIPEPFCYTMLKPKSDIGDYVNRKILFLQFLKFNIGEFYRTRYTHSGTLLTYHKKPGRNQFNGKIVVLTDGLTASAASFAASYLKHKAGATTIGTETGGGASGNNGGSFPQLTLPRSGIKVRFPLYHLQYSLPDAPEQGGVKPDHKLYYRPEDIIAGTDLALKKVKTLSKPEK